MFLGWNKTGQKWKLFLRRYLKYVTNSVLEPWAGRFSAGGVGPPQTRSHVAK